MDRYLITGFSGFVAHHFLQFLEAQQEPVQVLGIDIYSPLFDVGSFRYVACTFAQTDLLDKDKVDEIIFDFQPNYLLHLASFSSVSFSWKNPVASFANNTNIFLNLLEKMRQMNLQCRILSIGSSEEYGNVPASALPLREDGALNPLSPYAVARVSQEMLSKVYVDGYGMDIILTRSFNHIGPGQREAFVVSSFARQLVEMKHAAKPKKLVTGDLSIVRDFLDVRDVVKAYYSLFRKGRKGEVYNVCSGRGFTLAQMVQKMAMTAGLSVETIVDTSLIRPNDNKVIIGSNEKLKKETGWEAEYSFEKSVQDILQYWEHHLYASNVIPLNANVAKQKAANF